MTTQEDIKFRHRAWDYIHKVMHYDFEFMYIKSGDENAIPSGLIFSSDKHKMNWNKWPPEDEDTAGGKLILMDWVRAVDDMNMPIYECDVVKVSKIGEQEWNGYAGWGTKGCALVWGIERDINSMPLHSTYFDASDTKFSIIGNAYENPELIKPLIDLGMFNTSE